MATGQKRKLLGLLTLLFLYLILGAVIFWKVEDAKDTTSERIQELYVKLQVAAGNITFTEFMGIIQEATHLFEESHFGSASWSFYTALYFCGSVVTTIGKSPDNTGSYFYMVKDRIEEPSGLNLISFFRVI